MDAIKFKGKYLTTEKYEKLSEKEKEHFHKQLNKLNFDFILNSILNNNQGRISPINVLKVKDIEEKKNEYYKKGIEALKEGKIAMVSLAGGMGTRLGSNSPKGTYNIGITKDLYIFECQISELLSVVKECGNWIYLFIMTSEKNHDETVKFLKDKNYFGYNEKYIIFFNQEMSPTTDFEGNILMENNYTISTSPNGNGGWYSSMIKEGLMDIINENGIEYFNVYSIDNVLQKMADPYFIGATLLNNVDCGAKVIKKAYPDEKLGVICLEDNHPSITEYYELTDELRNSKDENGNYMYDYGVILNYLFKKSSLDKIASIGFPVHKVAKKIPYTNENGNLIEPSEPNGYKYETLILDMIKLLDSCLPYEVIREKEFAPIKNLHGVDSVDTARELLVKNGVKL